jgi:hypothetical protein
MHPLLDFGELDDEAEDGAEQIGLERGEKYEDVFDMEDEDLAPILGQLQSHLESIHGNSRQVDGVEDAIAGASVMLEGFVNRRIGRA